MDNEQLLSRWQVLLLQMVETATELMRKEIETGVAIKGLVVLPMDDEEWGQYQANKELTEIPQGELS